MRQRRNSSPRPIAAIEIRRSRLDLVVLEPGDDRGTVRGRTRSVPWRHGSQSLTSQPDLQELTAAMKKLAAEEKLAGAKISLAINGDYCVTRVVTGDAEAVRRELAMLQERSARYLSLGSGRKLLSSSIRALDARHQHALLTVANAKTLDAILQSVAGAGMEVDLIEPSLVAQCRLLGETGWDAEEPVLIINLGESGVELGISHRGRLLLDYRPGGHTGRQQVAEVVLRHLARLQRYCDRNYRYAQGQIRRVVLVGSSQAVESARAGFRHSDRVVVEVFDPANAGRQWQLDRDGPHAEISAALGTCLVWWAPHRFSPGPNLLEHARAKRQPSLLAALCRTLWPAAAAAVLAIAISAANWHEQLQVDRLVGQLETVESSVAQLWKLRRQIDRTDAETACLQTLAEDTADPSCERMLSRVAQCMSDDVWLERLTVDAGGKVTMAGNAYREDSIFQLARWLEPCPGFGQVAVQSTRPAVTGRGRVTKFELECEFDGCDDPEGGPGCDD